MRGKRSIDSRFEAEKRKIEAKITEVINKKYQWLAHIFNVIFKRERTVETRPEVFGTFRVKNDRNSKV